MIKNFTNFKKNPEAEQVNIGNLGCGSDHIAF
jgi:hypothetical protein